MIRELFLRDLSLWTCLWQSSALAGLGLIAGWLLRRRPARAYQVLLLAMTTAVAVPLLSAAVKHFDLGAFVARPTELSCALPEMTFAMPATEPDAGATQPTPPQSLPAGVVEPAALRIPWQMVLRYGWLAATLALLGRLVATFLYGVHLVRHASRVPCDHVERAVDSAASKLAISWGLKVRASRRIRSPLVWCWSQPSILLVPEACDDAQVDWAGVVAHELAHCKRRDHVTGLVAELAASLMPWNPLMWLSRRILIRLGEQACDDWVVASGQSSEDYAESLLHFRPQKQMAFWPAVVSSKTGLAHRIRRIVSDACGNPRVGLKWTLMLSIIATGFGLGLAFAQTRPAVSEASTKPEEQPALSLHKAAAAGNLEQVNKLLAQGADLHAKDEDGRTPLHAAAWHARKDMVEVLLARGANINETDGSGQTPLHLVATFGGKAVPELLLAQGAQIDARDKAGNTPLHAAAGSPSVDRDLLEFLIAKGADVKARNEAGQTPLHRVSMIRRLDKHLERTAEALLDLGAEIDAKDKSGRTPLHFAVENGNKELVDLLVAKGDDVRTTPADGTTLLHQAVRSGQLAMVELFLSRGIDINSAGSDGRTALHLALAAPLNANSININSIVEALIARGADVKARDVRGDTPLQIAVSYGHHRKDTVRLLLDKGAEVSTIQIAAYLGDLDAVKGFLERGGTVNAQDGDLLSPLGAAALGGHKDVAAFLISQGASVNAEDNRTSNATALHCAAAGGSKEVAELLLANGAKVDAKAQGDMTPLYVAASWGAKDVALLLIDHGADVNAEATGKWRPLDVAVRAGRKDVAKLLVEKGADTSLDTSHQDYLLFRACGQIDKDLAELVIRKGANVNSQAWGYAPAMEAMWSGYTKATKPADIPRLLGVLELLLDHGADPDSKDRWDWSLLHYACDNVDLTKLLLDRGANPNVRTCGGRTPLHFVADKGNKAVTQLLLSRGADMNAKDGDGRTPLSYAADFGDNDMWGRPRKTPLTAEAKAAKKEVARILREHGAKEGAPGRPGNIKPNEGATETATRAETDDAEEVKPPRTGSEKPAQSLHQAVAEGDFEKVRLLISAGTNVNEKDKDGLTALHVAVKHGHQALVELLITRGADSTAKDRYETTPLHTAASAGHQEITRLLLSSGADTNAQQGGSCLTPLHFACWKGHAEVAELLIQKGARLDATDKAGYPPLYYALWYEHNKTTRVLVAHGADVNFAPKGDWPPLYYALSSNDKGLVELLLDKGVRVPALHLAAFQGNLARVRSLCAGGIDVDSRDGILNWTALSWAVSGGQRDTAEFLILKGADVNAKAADDCTPLRQAAYVGSKESVELLLAHGAVASIGKPLHGAAQRGHVSVVEILIAQGADTDARDERGRTPLICACGSKQTKVSEVLIGKGADTNAKDDAGRTALHSACATGLRDVVKLLISKGTDINVKEKAGRSPLVYAQDNGYPEIADLLRKHGAKE